MLCRIYFLLLLFFCACLSSGAAVPGVVVTIKPIHSLVAGVMSGVKLPVLLMSGENSPHTQPVTPSELRKIQEAAVVIWVGPSYEAPLRRIIESVKGRSRVITLMDKPGVKLYPIRRGGLWGSHDHCSEKSCSEKGDMEAVEATGKNHDHGNHSMDGHLWLDPHNAKAIVVAITKELMILDPHHAEKYLSNSKNVIRRLENLDRELETLLIPVRDKPYVVYHDGTQYFDRHFKTKAVGVLMGDSHYGFNAQHFLEVCDYISTHKIECVFTEPQFPTDKIHDLLERTGIRIQTLDYLGIGLKADEDAYFLMMRRFTYEFLRGLKTPSNSGRTS
jgi:zinc transport system substrate-binding protein